LLSDKEILKVLVPKSPIPSSDNLLWCSREGMNWSGLVFVAKCIGQGVRGDLCENKFVESAVHKVVSMKLEMLRTDFSLMKPSTITNDSLYVMKSLLREHVEVLKCCLQIYNLR